MAEVRWSARRYTETQFREAVEASTSFAQVARALGLHSNGGNVATLRRTAEVLAVSTEHLIGRAYRRGGSYPRRKRPLAEVLVLGSHVGSSDLKARLLRAGLLEPKCYGCGATEVEDPFDNFAVVPIPLELDHINGDSTDNRIENLRLLDPTCHALTPTYRGRNVRRRRLAS